MPDEVEIVAESGIRIVDRQVNSHETIERERNIVNIDASWENPCAQRNAALNAAVSWGSGGYNTDTRAVIERAAAFAAFLADGTVPPAPSTEV